MVHVIGKRIQDPAAVVEVVERLSPPAIHRYVVKYRNDEDEISVLQVIAHSADEVRETMEGMLDRTDFEIVQL